MSAPGAHATAIVNALTVDVEDYFQVSAFAPYIRRAEWEARECRVERNVERILALLDAHGARATFFTLGWIAERYPALVRRIVDNGHEIASHGYGHHRVTEQARALFAADIRLTKVLLEDIGGAEVKGYRAPSFSIGDGGHWAFDALAEVGYRYSSSIYPIRHDHYGAPDASRFAHEVRPAMLEIPVATARVLGRNWPAGGGGYFRLMPYAMAKSLLRRMNRRDAAPAVFYFHPWEIDADQPRVPGIDARTRFRHYVNLSRMEAKLSRLLKDFRWGRVDEVYLGDVLAGSGEARSASEPSPASMQPLSAA